MSNLAKEKNTTGTNEWGTPDWLFSVLDKEFKFQIDLACNQENKKLDVGLCWPSADSLSESWHKLSKGWLWLNPPYSPLRPWIEKAQKEYLLGAKIVMLIPPQAPTRYFLKTPPTEIRNIIGKINFIDGNGGEAKANTRNSCLCIYGPSKLIHTVYVERSFLKNGLQD